MIYRAPIKALVNHPELVEINATLHELHLIGQGYGSKQGGAHFLMSEYESETFLRAIRP